MSEAVDVRDAFRIHRSSGGTAVALQGLSLEIDPGEIVVILGPSGSGKTTLLRVLAGFDSLSAGTAHVLGEDLARLSPGALARFRARNLGVLDQHYARALSPDLSCVHTVGLALELLDAPRSRAHAAAAALLERVGLGDRLDAHPEHLSGGEQQRVALCAALVHRPQLLLADEPAGELDAESAENVYGLIAELAREQRATAVVVSHDEAAARIANRLVHVRDGRVVQEGRPGEAPSLVVTEPGWIRLPDPLLDAIGAPRRLHAELLGDGVVLSAAAKGPRSHIADMAPRDPAPTPGSEVAAEVRDVVKRYPGGRRAVLDGLSRRFDSGTFTAVVGRSGSGKTTLLHLLAGLDRQTSGDVVVLGRELRALGRAEVAALRRRDIALVTQEPGLVPHLTARENVELGLQVRGAGASREAAAAALRQVGLAARVEHRADRLSAGERQRVAIARALAVRPRILLADEPTARLDQANARAVGHLLARLAHDNDTAVICATHDADLIAEADAELRLGPARTSPGVPLAAATADEIPSEAS